MAPKLQLAFTWLTPLLPVAALCVLGATGLAPGWLELVVFLPGILTSLLFGESAIVPISCIAWYAFGVGFIAFAFRATRNRQDRYVFVAGLFVLGVVVPLILFTAWQLFNEHFPKYPP